MRELYLKEEKREIYTPAFFFRGAEALFPGLFPAHEKTICPDPALPGRDIVMAGFAGDTGAAVLCEHKKDALLERLSASYLKKALQNAKNQLNTRPAAVFEASHCYYAEALEGGIFAALFEMAEQNGLGFRIDLRKLPLHQETVEICSCLGGSPYELFSAGTFVSVWEDGEAGVKKLEEAGIHARIIGRTAPGRRKVLLREGAERFLNRPSKNYVLTKEDAL